MPEGAVLFIDATDSVGRFDRKGSAVVDELTELHARIRQAAPRNRGRLVKTLGDGALLSFASGGGALEVARELVHGAAPPGKDGLVLRAAFCAGTVQEREGDVFGDPVHVAARLLDIAAERQILTTQLSLDRIPPSHHFRTRRLGRRELRGRMEPVVVTEILPEDEIQLTRQVTYRPDGTERGRALVLRYAGTVFRAGDGPGFHPITLGRTDGNTIVIDRQSVSRKHFTIQRRNGNYYLRDHSSNGTLIESRGGSPVPVLKEETLLIGSGRIVPGTTRGGAGLDGVDFSVVAADEPIPAHAPTSEEQHP